MAIKYLLSESYEGKYFKIKSPDGYFKDGIVVSVEKDFNNNYVFDPILADVYINSNDPTWELLEELPEETHIHHCDTCRRNSISYIDESVEEYDCEDCRNKHKQLSSYLIADDLYMFRTNNDLKIIQLLLDGISLHFNDEETLFKTESGLVVTHTEMGEFDSYPTKWYRIIPKEIIKF